MFKRYRKPKPLNEATDTGSNKGSPLFFIEPEMHWNNCERDHNL